MDDIIPAARPASIEVEATYDRKYKVIYLNGERAYIRGAITNNYKRIINQRGVELEGLIVIFEGMYVRAKIEQGRPETFATASQMVNQIVESLLQLNYLRKLAIGKMHRPARARS